MPRVRAVYSPFIFARPGSVLLLLQRMMLSGRQIEQCRAGRCSEPSSKVEGRAWQISNDCKLGKRQAGAEAARREGVAGGSALGATRRCARAVRRSRRPGEREAASLAPWQASPMPHPSPAAAGVAQDWSSWMPCADTERRTVATLSGRSLLASDALFPPPRRPFTQWLCNQKYRECVPTCVRSTRDGLGTDFLAQRGEHRCVRLQRPGEPGPHLSQAFPASLQPRTGIRTGAACAVVSAKSGRTQRDR